MTPRAVPFALVVLLAAAGPGHGRAQTPLSDADKVGLTHDMFRETGAGTPGCAVGVSMAGELAFSHGYGSANLDFGAPIGPESVFYIASVSKQFVAAAVARLSLDGRLDLDADIRQYIPEVPEWGDDVVTVRHLVHHTSGIRDYLTLMALAGRSYEDFFDNDDAIELISRQKALNFLPGAEHLYSNSGYVLLAELVERVSGMTLDEYSRRTFFGPLGMDRTHWGEDRTRVVRDRVTSYGSRDDGSYRRWVKNFHGKGDGNLLTSVADLARWDAIFYRAEPEWRELTELMLTPGVLNSGDTLQYAFGLSHAEHREEPVVSHGGGFLGFRTYLARFPERRTSFIVLCNQGELNPGAFSQRLADIWLFERREEEGPGARDPRPDPPEPASFEAPPAEYVGTYFSEELDADWTIEVRDGAVWWTLGREDEELAYRGDDRFQSGFVTMQFQRAPDGAVTGIVVDAGRVRGLGFTRRD